MSTHRLCAFLLFLFPMAISGADHFLTIGGGYSPAGNQVSIEKNIQFYQRVIDGVGISSAPHDLYFSDGKAPGRDVQFEPAESNVPDANRLLAKLFGSEKYLDLQYRDHEVEKVTGMTSPEAIESWFKKTGATLEKGDRLILYATAHGGRSQDKKNLHNTKLYLWNTRPIDVSRVAELIDDLPDGVQVTLIMAQCYSGGFAHTIFPSGDPKKGDQERVVAGFFSTTHDRMAAGCTPDIDEENYDEFSSHFWAALLGQSRTGKPIESADYDGDGSVSFAEAHAYTVLVSETIDIPQKTSDAFLRKRSQFKDKEHPNLLSKETPFSEIEKLANSLETTVLSRLSESLDLEGEKRYETARKRAEEIAKKRKQLAEEEKKEKRNYDSVRTALRQAVTARWPEVANLLKPESIRLITENGDELVSVVEGHPRHAAWVKSGKKRKQLVDERFRLDKDWAKLQRFLVACDSILLEENLKRLDRPESWERYEKLIAAEGELLGSQKS